VPPEPYRKKPPLFSFPVLARCPGAAPPVLVKKEMYKTKTGPSIKNRGGESAAKIHGCRPPRAFSPFKNNSFFDPTHPPGEGHPNPRPKRPHPLPSKSSAYTTNTSPSRHIHPQGPVPEFEIMRAPSGKIPTTRGDEHREEAPLLRTVMKPGPPKPGNTPLGP